ncbi:proline-rich protein 2-like [Meles meles]|uniref:proline-rich protein 2-like n=1 Tax=Meles meles TaxID=9662 RepID=UPI001E69A8B9|nr:proline-rich protein 2-like [Meles meles]
MTGGPPPSRALRSPLPPGGPEARRPRGPEAPRPGGPEARRPRGPEARARVRCGAQRLQLRPPPASGSQNRARPAAAGQSRSAGLGGRSRPASCLPRLGARAPPLARPRGPPAACLRPRVCRRARESPPPVRLPSARLRARAPGAGHRALSSPARVVSSGPPSGAASAGGGRAARVRQEAGGTDTAGLGNGRCARTGGEGRGRRGRGKRLPRRKARPVRGTDPSPGPGEGNTPTHPRTLVARGSVDPAGPGLRRSPSWGTGTAGGRGRCACSGRRPASPPEHAHRGRSSAQRKVGK